jgi:hypothetical protein
MPDAGPRPQPRMHVKKHVSKVATERGTAEYKPCAFENRKKNIFLGLT